MQQQEPERHKATVEDTETLLAAFGLFTQLANKPALDQRVMERFGRRELAFEWTHMGHSELPIARLIETLQSHGRLSPPRTGHLGNWSNIVNARAGPRDYNNLTCGRLGIGYPLLFDFNQTESDDAGNGDWSYMPGSLVERCQRRVLPLFTWDGRAFVRRDRQMPLFTPFTLTEAAEQLLPLSSYHRAVYKRLDGVTFRLQSDLLLRHEVIIRRVLRTILAHACRRQEELLRRTFDRRVLLDGRVERATLQAVAGGFALSGQFYPSADALIDHAFLPVRAAAEPDSFLGAVRQWPESMPLMSASLLVLLLAVLNTHFPLDPGPGTFRMRPCNPHVHWGGIPMAGYPPKQRGYFNDNVRHLRKLFEPVIRDLDVIDPVFFMLVPAGVFNLCPHSAFPNDVEMVAGLLDLVATETAPLAGKPSEMSRRIEASVGAWHQKNAPTLSRYLASRFVPARAGLASLSEPLEGDLILLPSLTRLTLQQATMTLGALSRLPWHGIG